MRLAHGNAEVMGTREGRGGGKQNLAGFNFITVFFPGQYARFSQSI